MNYNLPCAPIKSEDLADCSRDKLLWIYKTMILIRLVEEKIADLVAHKEIICPCHLYIGQEVVATGVCAHLRESDYVFSTHRSHGHYLAKGGNLKTMMAELFGRKTGCSGGKGGSMHLTSPDMGFPGSSAIVAGSIPLAVGVALAFQQQNKDGVAVTFFGDGAINEGVFFESLNFASLKRLPVVFICENNLYSTHLPIAEIQADTDIYKKAAVFNMPGLRIDGNNLGEVFASARQAIERARRGEGPSLMECLTYRWRGHVGPSWDIDKGLRDKEEIDWWVNRCGLKRVEEYLEDRGILTAAEMQEIARRTQGQIEDAILFAQNSPFPDETDLNHYVYKEKGNTP